ncbi:hypothetical protein QVD17_01055 [Tagetes erecta]|uniref:Leucine-rich repeat-containing N-terminal plant-type domain-containing protein n=1 Tax=Tagetes erecta TaxID=13708 RepID=A0AAD8L6X8_TARER|nr:hypothetical protein QVD17_01055 [Tagetes erecta]
MANTIFHKHFVHHATFIVIHSLVVLASIMKTTTTTSLRHQARDEAAGDFKCIEKERQALLHFKSYIRQDPNGLLSTWTQYEKREEATSDCCEWSGVTCNNQTGHVITLDLSFGDLEGKISPSLVNLTNLSHLDLSWNSFSGPIPMFIGSMTQLRHLNLQGNSFNGTISMFIGSMTHLRYLDLSFNELTGNIPMFIGSITHLRYLSLGVNYFNGTIPMELGNLTKLQELSLEYLSNCTIENLDWLSHLSELEDLHMSGISLANAKNWVNVILGLKKLSYLSLSGCDLSQVMNPYSYSSFNSSSTSSSIVYLNLRSNNLNSSIYHWLFPLTSNKLEGLYLDDNKLDWIPESLGNHCGLTYLSINYNSMSVKISDLLANLSSGCTSVSLEWLLGSYNQLTGSLSDNIQMFSSLQCLYLSNNQLNEIISENVLRLPKLVFLDVSSNSLKSFISEYIGETKILRLYLSNNSFEGIPSNTHMSDHSNIEEIDISSCKLGPHFPNWIIKLKNLTHLNIANNRISYTFSLQFWNMWFSQLIDIDLSSNNFSGSIHNVSFGLQRLDLSHNKFYGQILFLCQITYGSLYFLDLSNNSFVGEIPDCLWHFKKLKILDLGHNNFSGRLPFSIGYLISIEVLKLDNNKFSGELPLSLQNCTRLTFLELGVNKFSGYVPIWIGERLSLLYALRLTSNKFFGTIPSQFCQLVDLHFLDLSMNKLNGTIPSCLNNLTSLVHDRFSSHYQNQHNYDYYPFIYVDHVLIYWQGIVREFSKNIGMLKSIDLSNNFLTGQIPYELTNLLELMQLNLSNNVLSGTIPEKIGDMKELQILDLSRNKLSGQIPSSISGITFLDFLDVSYNNLSGRIPVSTQLQSFAPLRYIGNARLCGLPLPKYCPGDKELEAPIIGQNEGRREGIDELDRLFYIGGASGFVTGFWIVCFGLHVNWHGRNEFFHIVDNMKDWVYIKVTLFITRRQRPPCI